MSLDRLSEGMRDCTLRRHRLSAVGNVSSVARTMVVELTRPQASGKWFILNPAKRKSESWTKRKQHGVMARKGESCRDASDADTGSLGSQADAPKLLLTQRAVVAGAHPSKVRVVVSRRSINLNLQRKRPAATMTFEVAFSM